MYVYYGIKMIKNFPSSIWHGIQKCQYHNHNTKLYFGLALKYGIQKYFDFWTSSLVVKMTILWNLKNTFKARYDDDDYYSSINKF
jgi:hypothetical protein